MITAALRVAAWIYRAYYATLRVRYVLPDGTSGRASDYPIRETVFAICERDALALAGLMAGRRFTVLVAHGTDGNWATRMLEALGCRAIRGSTRRGASRALRALLATIHRNDDPIGLVVDGPLGPDGIAQPGAVILAMRSKRPLVALGAAATHRLVFRGTWSRIFLPLPFSRVTIAVESSIDGGQDVADVDAATDQLTRDLDRARRRADVMRPAAGQTWQTALQSITALAIALRDAVPAALALPFLLALWALPWRASARLGRAYGSVAWLCSPRARRVGAINLRRAFGDSLTLKQARRDVRFVFGSLGQGIAEGIQFARRFKHAPDSVGALYELEDPELERRILADPRPRIFVTGHLGSWELAAGLAASRTGRPGAAVVRRIDNTWLNALWRRARVRHHAEWIEKHGASAQALDRLRRGHDLVMLLDENGGYRGLFVPLFGRLASTRKTPAVLSLVTGAPIIVGACIRRPGRPFLFRLAQLEPNRRLTPDEAIRDLTARIVSTYEAWIRDAPLQWRWVHWRWKTRPDATEESYTRADLTRTFTASADRRDGFEAIRSSWS